MQAQAFASEEPQTTGRWNRKSTGRLHVGATSDVEGYKPRKSPMTF